MKLRSLHTLVRLLGLNLRGIRFRTTPDSRVPRLSAYARCSHFDGLVFGLFYGEARPPASARTSAPRCTQVTLGP